MTTTKVTHNPLREARSWSPAPTPIDPIGLKHPNVVNVPMGVGALMAAAITHYRGETGAALTAWGGS